MLLTLWCCWFLTVSHRFLLFLIISYCFSLFLTVSHHVHGFSPFLIVSHHFSLFLIVSHLFSSFLSSSSTFQFFLKFSWVSWTFLGSINGSDIPSALGLVLIDLAFTRTRSKLTLFDFRKYVYSKFYNNILSLYSTALWEQCCIVRT